MHFQSKMQVSINQHFILHSHLSPFVLTPSRGSTTPAYVSIVIGSILASHHLTLPTQGIITSDCKTDLNHCVQLTGFGTDNGVDYWSVRNR